VDGSSKIESHFINRIGDEKMVQVNIKITDIELDPTGRMITLTIDATIAGRTEEVRVCEMVGNLRGLTDIEVRDHFKGSLQDVIHQRLGELDEVTPERTWKRAQDFIGKTYIIEVT